MYRHQHLMLKRKSPVPKKNLGANETGRNLEGRLRLEKKKKTKNHKAQTTMSVDIYT